jgi:hypothetical protein
MGAVTSTANDLITGALRNIGAQEAGEPLNPNDANDALQVLNDLLDSLSTDKLFVYTASESILAWTPGKYKYTIGNPIGGTFAGYTTSGSPLITGLTTAPTITFGVNASGVVVGGTLTDILGAIPANATIVSYNAGATIAITFTAPPTGTTGNLTGWAGGAVSGLLTFSDGETRSGAITVGGVTTWATALTGTPTAAGNQVNTNTLTMSVPATQTLIAADVITYTTPGDFAIARPLRIRPGFTRITASGNTGLDYWWDLCSIDDYNELGYKGVPGPWPFMAAYQTTFPLGTLFIYPAPQQAGEVHLWTDVVLTQFTSLTQTISMPQGYSRAFKKLLSLELAPEYGKSPGLELMRQAKEARDFLKSMNETPVKKLNYDRALIRPSGKDAGFIIHGGFGSNY